MLDSRPPNIIRATAAILGEPSAISNKSQLFQYLSHAITTFEEFGYKTSPLSMTLKIEGAKSAYQRLLAEIPKMKNAGATEMLARFETYYAETIHAHGLKPPSASKAHWDLSEINGQPVLVRR